MNKELIGAIIEVVKASNKTLVGKKGKVIDEKIPTLEQALQLVKQLNVKAELSICYFVSLCNVCFLQWLQNLLSSRRSLSFFLFLCE